jgi:hypothetical protein
MSAAEIIEQIKALPPEERRAVFAFVQIAEQDAPADDTTVRYADDRAFEAVVDRVFEKHAELFKKLAE